MNTKPKRWGIKVRDSAWLQESTYQNNYKSSDVVYNKKADAVKDAKDFNSTRKETIYTVEEYK